ncbi:MAG: hypothetical protein HN341_15605 [Verrucomicrobia bacterium]|jgi:hypothetical protein|nr:hypothetical protein [Verrucomicrobiota bacterium]
MNLSPPSEAELAEIIQREEWFAEATRARIEDAMDQFRTAIDAFDDHRLRIAAKVVSLTARMAETIALPESVARGRTLTQIRDAATQLRHDLIRAERVFIRRDVRMLLPTPEELSLCEGPLEKLCTALHERYKNTTEPDTRQCVSILESLITRCRCGQNNPTDRRT